MSCFLLVMVLVVVVTRVVVLLLVVTDYYSTIRCTPTITADRCSTDCRSVFHCSFDCCSWLLVVVQSVVPAVLVVVAGLIVRVCPGGL